MGTVDVEIVYAEPDRVWTRTVTIPEGTTIRQAIEASGVLAEVPTIDLARNRVGVYGAVLRLEDRASAGDRIEIYRPLLTDPKEARRRRAARSRTSG